MLPHGVLKVTTARDSGTLREVLKRAKDFGITLNREKCELEFYGYKFTKDGYKYLSPWSHVAPWCAESDNCS
jgi:hypothetical protein